MPIQRFVERIRVRGPEQLFGGPVGEGHRAVGVDDDDPFADRPDDGVELRGTGPLRGHELCEPNLVAEPTREQLLRFGPLPTEVIFGRLRCGDIVESVNRELDFAASVADGGRRDPRPAFGARLAIPEPDDPAGSRGSAEHLGPGQVPPGERLAILTEELEPVSNRAGSAGNQLVGGLVAGEPRRGDIREDEAAIAALDP